MDSTLFEYEQVRKAGVAITCHIASLKVVGQLACNQVPIRDCNPVDPDEVVGTWCLNCLRCRPDYIVAHTGGAPAARPKTMPAQAASSSST